MASHDDCTNWDYEKHPKAKDLKARCDRVTGWVAKRPKRFDRYGYDTRPAHRLLFAPYAPTLCKCLAGTYRGSKSCPHLVAYSVGVPGTGVGSLPAHVETAMAFFDSRCKSLVSAYGNAAKSGDPAVALVELVSVLCDLLEFFFTVHPYANGNGHTGRLLIWVILARHGFVPKKWSIDDKQPYRKALEAYRAGSQKELQMWLIRLAR